MKNIQNRIKKSKKMFNHPKKTTNQHEHAIPLVVKCARKETIIDENCSVASERAINEFIA
jgi:hypothetical protein